MAACSSPAQPLEIAEALRQLDAADVEYATRFVERLLDAAQHARASDVHLQPIGDRLEVAWRLDGALQPLGTFPAGIKTDVVTRLKVLAGLLTYRSELPQEGRIHHGHRSPEIRVSTFPTIHGERAAVRLFGSHAALEQLPQLGLPQEVLQRLSQHLAESHGAILVCGPAGSGKTTTAYACLRHLVEVTGGRRSLFSLEDPVEVPVAGVAQSQANPAAGFSLGSGLRSLLRQDPEVIFVGEIRDKETAEVFLQASLTGQLVLSTFHAGSAAEAITRLLDMDLEPYQLRSGLSAILAQRLVRRLCTECGGLPSAADERRSMPSGCPACQYTGYRGRTVLVEMLEPAERRFTASLLDRRDTRELEQAAVDVGMVPLAQRAREAVAKGLTDAREILRAFPRIDLVEGRSP